MTLTGINGQAQGTYVSDIRPSHPETNQFNHMNRAQQYYQAQYNYLQEFYRGIYMNRFRYENTPETLNMSVVEYLFMTGIAGVAVGLYEGELRVLGGISNISDNGKVTAGVATGFGNGMYTPLGVFEPTIREIDLGKLTMYDPVTKQGEYVVMVNKFTAAMGNGSMSDMSILDMFADEIATIKRESFINMNAMKTATVMYGKKGQIDKAQVVDNMGNGVEVMQVGEDFNLQDIQVFNPAVKDYQDTFQKKVEIKEAELLKYMGINTNPSGQKKERVTRAEAESNNGLTALASEVYIAPRRQQIELLNDMLKERNFETEGEIEVHFAYDDITDITGLISERNTVGEPSAAEPSEDF